MAKQAKIEDIMIPIFDGACYSSWKLRLTTLLEYKECHEPAIVLKNETTDAAWKKKDLKARTIIMSTISDKQLEYITECKTAYEMIKKFDKIYLTQSTAMQIICRGKIEDIKLSNYNTIEDFFVDFEKTINEFKMAGGKINEPEKLRYLLRALPPSYSYIGDFLDVIPEEQRTVDYVQSKIKEKNMATNDTEKKNNVSTFTNKLKCNVLPAARLAIFRRTVGIIREIIKARRAIKDIRTTKDDINPVEVTEVYRGVSTEVDSTEVAAEAEVKVIPKVNKLPILHRSHGQLKYVTPKLIRYRGLLTKENIVITVKLSGC